MNFNAFRFLCFLGFLCFVVDSSSVIRAESIHANTKKTGPIGGFQPHIQSIGAVIDAQNNVIFDSKTGDPILTVGSSIYVPSLLCENILTADIKLKYPFLEDRYFQQLDSDFDKCQIEEDQLEWFILEPKNGNWDSVQTWDDLLATEITPQTHPESFLTPTITDLPSSHNIFSVPEVASGKRIGFIYTPKTQTGFPQKGSPIKVWDLSYFFKQYPSRLYQHDHENQGEKVTPIPALSAGGEVHPSLLMPEISNLRLEGKLSLDESLEVEYDFLPNTALEYQDRSIFCWGKPESTKQLASRQDPSCLTEPNSPKITINDLQEGLEISVRPIKEENGILVLGDIYTTDIFEHENTYVEPNVDEVTIYYYSTESTTPPENGILPGQALGGSYLFVPGSNLVDTSTVSWSLNDDEPHKIANSIPADIINNKVRGELPEYNVREEDMGKVLKLTVHAKDGNEISGNNFHVQVTKPEGSIVSKLNFVGNFFVGDEIFVEYDWQMGKNGHRSDRSEFIWETPTSPNLKGQIDDSAQGNSRKSTAMDLYQTGTIATKSTNGIYVIKPGDVGGTIKFNLTAKDGAGITGNTEAISYFLDNEFVSTKKPPSLSLVRLMNSASGATQQVLNSSFTFVQYYYSPGENIEATDMSEMVWYLPDGSTKFSKINNTSTRWTELRRTNNINNMQIGDGTYFIKPEDLEKIIKVEMTPVDSEGIRGTTVVLQNEIVYRQTDAVAPKVSNLKIKVQDGGEPRLGTALYGSYDYTPGRGHGWGQDRSYYEWIGARTVSGRTQSTGRTGSYIIRLDDVGKTISLKVTAHSEVLGPIQGNTESQSVTVQDN